MPLMAGKTVVAPRQAFVCEGRLTLDVSIC
jgi:hypothetical protein